MWTVVRIPANGKHCEFTACECGTSVARTWNRTSASTHTVWAYVESVQMGRLLYLSGMLPAVGHEPKFVGRLRKELNVEQGREAARIAALNVLSAAREHLGSLDKVTKVVKLAVYLATEGDFVAHPAVADAASELLRDVFGADKLSVRMVLGVASLPLGMPVELEAILEVEE